VIQLLALQTFLICFNGQLYSTEKEVVYSNNTKIGLVEIKDAVDLKASCDPDVDLNTNTVTK